VPPVVAVAAGQLVQLELVASAAPGPPLLAGGQPVPTGRCPLVSVVPAAVGQLLLAVGQPVPTGWAAEGQPAQLVSALPAGRRSVAPFSHLSTLLSSLMMMMMLLMTMTMRTMRMMTLLMLMMMMVMVLTIMVFLMTSSTKAQTKE